jgi:hypothetical protein
MDSERLKYGDNNTTCIITVSCNDKTIGRINNINDDVERILGHKKSEIIS